MTTLRCFASTRSRSRASRASTPGEAIDLFLHASALGMLEVDWLLICPRCACAVESFARLRAVLRRFRCPECHNEYEAAMDDFIAIYFTVSPQICAIRYHHPETLDPFDYMFFAFEAAEGMLSAISSDTEAGFTLRVGGEVASEPQRL
jgi:hypothetical protein